MYLSRVELNPYRRETVRALDSPQLMHAAVMASFNVIDNYTPNRVMWRIDRLNSIVYLLIQSNIRPDLHHIIDQYGRPDSNQKYDVLDYGDFVDSITEGQSWRFRLRANPTHSIPVEGKRGKVVPHVTAEQQIKWLIEKSQKCGFSVVDDCGYSSVQIIHRTVKSFKHNNARVTLSIVTFEGILHVDDRNVFIDTIEKGIGRAKAYGCGMLTLARL